MNSAAILAIGAGPDLVDALRTALAHEPRARLLVTSNAVKALESIERTAPALVLVDGGSNVGAALERCREVRESPVTSMAMLAVVVDHWDAVAAIAWTMGVDQVLGRPLSSRALHDLLAAAFRIGALNERLGANEGEIARLGEELAAKRLQIEHLEAEQRRHEERIRHLLLGLLELGVPGAIERGQRVSEMATKIAARFQVPSELLADLDHAARLHELGRLAMATEMGRESESAPDHSWRYSQSTVAILRRASAFEGAAEIIGGMYENWDGTGRPARWQAGQIPLRCRILRVLADWIAALESRRADPHELIDAFEDHGGTLYDPLVVVHLKALIDAHPDDETLGQTLVLPVSELREGMVLAEDLYTDSGLKLVARGTELTLTTLEVIRRRHRAEPITSGAAVRRPAA